MKLVLDRSARRANALPAALTALALLAALVLCWRVRDQPLPLGGAIRVDALSAFFGVATLAGLLLATLVYAGHAAPSWRVAAAALLLLLGYAATLTLAVPAALALATLLLAGPARPPGAWWHLATLRALGRGAPALLAAACLLASYAALALAGTDRLEQRGAGLALTSGVFWFALLAAVAPIAGLALAGPARPGPTRLCARCFALAWLYPLARLYSLGAWNSGWSLATLLLGVALACWCMLSALFQPQPGVRAARTTAGALALALAGLGLGTNAGVAAACYSMLSVLVLMAGAEAMGGRAVASTPPRGAALPDWLLSTAVPFAAPFVAAWMLIGASMAGGAALPAGGAWLAALLQALGPALWPQPAGRSRARTALAGLSLALGLGAPLVLRGLIEPVIAQLQGGLSLYGDLNIWPWVGLATANSARVPVTTWPTIAVALLMLVLCALVYVVARLGAGGASAPVPEPAAPPETIAGMLQALRRDVPWIDLLLGRLPPEEQLHEPR